MSHGRALAFRYGCTPLRNGYGLRTIDRLLSPLTLPTTQSLERILYVWAIRHPASGYVQGINDLATPFFEVFLSAYVGRLQFRLGVIAVLFNMRSHTPDADPEDIDPSILPPSVLAAVEADSFWCLSRLLDGIQDNYISAQPGIQRSVKRMAELVARIDAPLSEHLAAQGVEFMQFAFRWMNCLLMREISVKNTVRMWDTYLVRLFFIWFCDVCVMCMTGRRPRCLFSISLVCLLGISCTMERQAP